MRRLALVALLALVGLLPGALAHGELEVNELEVLAIRDFEGMEDSFPWGGFEIWDVYVGDGYNETLDADGVYFKVNFAGDGTQRPPGGETAPWTIAFRWTVGEEDFEREITHEGETLVTSFESLQWMVAGGNVLQIKAWAPVADPIGKEVTNIEILSSVAGEPRDAAPGGVYAPASSTEVPVSAPGTPVFPPFGQGRMVDAIPLTGSAKWLELAVETVGEGAFALNVANPLEEQGQHVALTGEMTPGWNLTTDLWGASLDGGAATRFQVTLRPEARPGEILQPLALDLLTDIGGRRTVVAFLDGDNVVLTEDPALARPATLPGEQSTPGLALVAVVAAALLLALARRRGA